MHLREPHKVSNKIGDESQYIDGGKASQEICSQLPFVHCRLLRYNLKLVALDNLYTPNFQLFVRKLQNLETQSKAQNEKYQHANL